MGGFVIVAVMPVFTPPTDNFVHWDDGSGDGIFASLRPGPRGRNVFKMLDGSFTENHPSDYNLVDITYHGGHEHTITQAEADDLIAAGYGDYIT